MNRKTVFGALGGIAIMFLIGWQANNYFNLIAPSSMKSGQKAVAAANTAEALVATSTPCLSVTVKAKHANTNMIYVGASDVTSSNGFVLDAGEAVTVDIDNVADVYIDADTNGEGVSFIYNVR